MSSIRFLQQLSMQTDFEADAALAAGMYDDV
jgi:hypothetical protein